MFGFATFGKVYGLIICLAGILNFAQSGLDALRHKAFHKDPVPLNVILLVVALCVGIPLVVYVWLKARKIQREGLEESAEHAREIRMPGVPPTPQIRMEDENGEGRGLMSGQKGKGYGGTDRS